MFNSYEYNPTQKVSINAVSGTLSKTCEKSWFVSYKYTQNGFEHLMSDKPTLQLENQSIYERTDVVVLQTMLMGDERVLFEIIKKSDFEQLKEQKGE